MVDLPKLQTGAIDVQVFASYTPGYLMAGGGADYARANSRLLALLNAVHWTVNRNARSLTLIQSDADIERPARWQSGIMAASKGLFVNERTASSCCPVPSWGFRMLS